MTTQLATTTGTMTVSGMKNGQKRPAEPVRALAQPGIDPLRASMLQLERDLNVAFAERDREIRGILLGLLAREHVLLLGPAGTGKSALAGCACAAISGATFFQWLLTRFSAPEEMFGPISLDGLKQDTYRRITAGKLPEAHVAFLDEIFKANSAVLNSLLTALNERGFDNDKGRTQIPLEICVGASNEMPEGPELAALYDRFLVKFWVAPTKTPQSFSRLLLGSEPSITASVTLTDLHGAQSAVEAMPIHGSLADELFKLRGELEKKGITASDRRWRKCMRILRASAWLDGCTEVTQETFPILAHVLWQEVVQIDEIRKLVAKYTSSELASAQEAFDAMSELISQIPQRVDDATAEAANKMYPRILRELGKAADLTKKLGEECASAQSKARIERLHKELVIKKDDLKRTATEALGLNT